MNQLIKQQNKKGFTLIELIVVIVIIGILAAIIIPRLSGFSATAKLKADYATAKTIATAAMVVYADKGVAVASITSTTPADITQYLPNPVPSPQTGGTWTLVWSGSDLKVTNGTTTYFPTPTN